MLTYDLSKRGPSSLYEYIYTCIKNDILCGNIKSGDKLPSKRTLADNLSVSLITIQNAYEQLIYEGYIYTIEKKGYYASDIGSYSVTSEAKLDSSSLDIEPISQVAQLINFQNNNSDISIFPFSTWAKLSRKTLLDNESVLIEKPDNKGHIRLRRSIANYLKEYKGMNVSPNNIIIGAGMEYLYGMILQLLGRSKMIAVEEPGHTKVSKIYESNGTKVLHVSLDDDGFSPANLGHSNVSCIHISPSHQFPTGIVMPASRRHKLIDQARTQNFYIIEDDYDSELRYEGKPIPAMASLAPDKVIYMNTFTKTLMNSVRIAYMVLPDTLMSVYTNRLGFYSCTVSSMEQLTLSEFIDGGYYERHINRMRFHYRKCRKNFITCFNNSNLCKYFSIIENNAGLHFLIKSTKKIDDSKFTKALKDKGILLSSLTSFCERPAEKYKHLFLINYFSIDEATLINIFNTMAMVIEG